MKANEKTQNIRREMLKWYRTKKRNLPWRKSDNPYHIWVSEIMLQQTQVKAVLPYYKNWLKIFPTVKALAKAREARVLKYWEGLGYYARARNFHRAAKIIVAKYQGKVPQTFDEIFKLPGIGRYTASAILSIAFNKKFPVLDGNVKRVISRWFCLEENGYGSTSEKRLWEKAEEVLSQRSPGNFNQAMMELGATVCNIGKPKCSICPVNKFCEAFLQRRQAEFPPPKVKRKFKKIDVSAAVIWRKGKVYVQQRPRKGLMGSLWEFPGGKLEKGESPEECLVREIQEELGVNGNVEKKIMTIKHSYTQFRVTLHVFIYKIHCGQIKPNQCESWRWATPSSLKKLPFPSANIKIVRHIIENGKP
tara:strand:- start:3181 stop:4266 length:1086 start_codon:yes stop_codon:yes gene_type:complete